MLVVARQRYMRGQGWLEMGCKGQEREEMHSNRVERQKRKEIDRERERESERERKREKERKRGRARSEKEEGQPAREREHARKREKGKKNPPTSMKGPSSSICVSGTMINSPPLSGSTMGRDSSVFDHCPLTASTDGMEDGGRE